MQTAEIPQAVRARPIDRWPNAVQRALSGTALALALAAVWLLMHRYRGLDGDAQIYALQALARINPALGADLYFQHTSQDSYSVFSPIYASVIKLMDLQSATLLLTVVFIAWFLAAAWLLARELCGRDIAWLCVGALIVLPGVYGGSGIFQFSDLFLTARLPAQAMVVTSLVLHCRGWTRLGLLTAVAALFIHPLMALPGLLLLICLSVALKTALLGAGGGVVLSLGMALVAARAPAAAAALHAMDPAWLEVVRERSQFLFLNLWSGADWKRNLQPFLSLTLTVSALQDARIRRFGVGAMLVGLAGLAVALVASCIAPVALLVQGQAWRWVWITHFAAILLLAPTVLAVWRDRKCGPLCSMLLLLGWTLSFVDGFTGIAFGLLVWALRPRIPDRAARYLRWIAYALGMAAAVAIAHRCRTILAAGSLVSGYEPAALGKLSNIAMLGIPAIVFLGVSWHWLKAARSLPWLTVTSVTLLASAAYLAPKALDATSKTGSPALAAEFADWREVIPAASSVYLAGKYDTGAFVWFALGRPNYLSPDQSAGVVFSRETALEIRRRSEIVLPLERPFWKIQSSIIEASRSKDRKVSDYRPLTAATLISICGDPELGFVIAKENVGFDAMTHTHAGVWKDWNLYDCRRVRSAGPQA
jgi:hypothetical protein